MGTDRQTGVTTLLVAFRNFVKDVAKSECSRNDRGRQFLEQF
jgi:hypothetical protein